MIDIFVSHSVTAIHIRKHRISSDLRSESHVGVVSTGVGDHLGIQRAVILFCLRQDNFASLHPACSYAIGFILIFLLTKLSRMDDKNSAYIDDHSKCDARA